MDEEEVGYYCYNWWALALNTVNDHCLAFNNILVDRQVFVAHLHSCEVCHKNRGKTFAQPMTDQEFHDTVKSLWKVQAQKRGSI